MEKNIRFQLIRDFQREIIQIYKENDLSNLAGLDREFILNGRNIMLWYHETINKFPNRNRKFDFNRCFEDLVFCSDEILFFTALLFFYRPFLQDPIKEGFSFGNKTIYPYTQTIEVSRFNMYANTLYEKVYNYWDRIGDLIAVFLPEYNSTNKTYFVIVIDNFPKAYINSDNLKWLKDFREYQFKVLNKKRKDIVHNELLGTYFRWEHAKNPTDKEKIEKLVNERYNLPDYFKGHIELTKSGFEKSIQLLEELSMDI